MSEKPKILWMSDVPGWAYHNRATVLAAMLGNYDHYVLPVGGMPQDMFVKLIGDIKPDITVLMHPSGFQTFNDLGKIVFTATGMRAMEL